MQEASAAAFGLFGRDDTLRALVDALDEGGSMIVVGDPGSGKSSLLKVADQLAQRRGHRVLSVTPTEFDRGLPFAGLAELVAQCPHGADRDLPAPQRRALAVALQLADPTGRRIDSLAVPLAVRGLLMHLCEAEPVTLIVDDLQWLDRASAGSLAFAARHGPADPARLSVLVGTRPDPAGGDDLLRSVAEPRRQMTLAPLEEWAVGLLLRAHLGPRWTPPLVAGVARACGGNPLLALEIARAMQDDVLTWRDGNPHGFDLVFPVPPSLAHLLSERVARLPTGARDALLLVSAAGRLTVAQLRDLFGSDRATAALEAAADAAVASVGAGSVVAFAHPLLASAIYEAATPGQRRRAHRALAELLPDPVERARHRARTLGAPDDRVAAELADAAGISRDRGAPQLAGELWEAAGLATPAETDAGLGRWLSAVDAYHDAGDDLAAQAALGRGSALVTEPDQLAQVLVRRLTLAADYGDSSLAERALRLAPAGSEVRAEILRVLGTVHRMDGHGKEAWDATQMAIAESVAVGRADIQLAALNERVAIERLWGLGDPTQTLRDVEHLVTTALDVSAADWAWTQSFFAAWDDHTAVQEVRGGITAAVDAGRYGDLSDLYIALVLVLVRASRIPDARNALDEADRSGAWTKNGGLQEGMARTLVNAYSGRLDEARDAAHTAMKHPLAMRSTYWRAGFLAQLGFIEVAAQAWEPALVALREVASIFDTTGMVDLEQLLWGVDYADAALQLGLLDEVEAAVTVLQRQGAAGRPEATVAADRCRAMLAATRGDVDDALSALVGIADMTGAECPFEAARSKLALGQLYRRAGHKAKAHQTLTAAADDFHRLGIPRWTARAHAEAERVGLHPATSTLTATERRVAELVGAGHSNQETAAALFISVKTVEANLTRIYRKLSVRSRTELANRMNALGSAG